MKEVYDGGVWWVENGELHLDIPKLLKRLGFPDTQENRDLAVRTATKVAREIYPDLPIIVTD